MSVSKKMLAHVNEYKATGDVDRFVRRLAVLILEAQVEQSKVNRKLWDALIELNISVGEILGVENDDDDELIATRDSIQEGINELEQWLKEQSSGD